MSLTWEMYQRYIREQENEADRTGEEVEIISYDEFYGNYITASEY